MWIMGSKPEIRREFTIDTNLPVAELTKYIRKTFRLDIFDTLGRPVYPISHTYCVFRDDGTVSDEQVSFRDSDGSIRVRPCVSWIKSTYALADYFIVPNKKPENDIYKTPKDENAVTIKTVFEHSDRLVSEYRESGYRFSKKLVWSLEIEVLSRDSDRIKHKCSNGKIIEYDSAGYGIREHFGDIDTKECRTGKTE